LDLTRDVSLRFVRAATLPTGGRRTRWPTSEAPLTFPVNTYEREAIELYMYGREAQGMLAGPRSSVHLL
jgi:hypothetical protein